MNCAIILWLWLGLTPDYTIERYNHPDCVFDVRIDAPTRVLYITGQTDVASFQLPLESTHKRLTWTEHGSYAWMEGVGYRRLTGLSPPHRNRSSFPPYET